jgi:hypothetical protein
MRCMGGSMFDISFDVMFRFRKCKNINYQDFHNIDQACIPHNHHHYSCENYKVEVWDVGVDPYLIFCWILCLVSKCKNINYQDLQNINQAWIPHNHYHLLLQELQGWNMRCMGGSMFDISFNIMFRFKKCKNINYQDLHNINQAWIPHNHHHLLLQELQGWNMRCMGGSMFEILFRLKKCKNINYQDLHNINQAWIPHNHYRYICENYKVEIWHVWVDPCLIFRLILRLISKNAKIPRSP